MRGLETLGDSLIAYCLMGNHFHLVIKVGAETISSIMHRLLTAYAKSFNQRHERSGHLFQARFSSKLIGDDAYLQTVFKYVHLNPVKAGLVKNPKDWPWSSAGRFADFVDDIADDFDPWADPKTAAVLLRDESREAESLAQVGERVCANGAVPLRLVLSGTRVHSVSAVRAEVARAVVKEGHSMSAAARWLGVSVCRVSQWCKKLKG